MKIKRTEKRGLTLIELLVVISILGVVMAAIAACVSAGIKAWDAARDFNRVESRIVMGLRVIEKDLANSFPTNSQWTGFEGDAESMKFTRRLITGSPEGGKEERLLLLDYDYDDGVVTRASRLRGEDSESKEEDLLSNLDLWSLSYDTASGTNEPDWVDSCTNTFRSIRIGLAFTDEQGRGYLVTNLLSPPMWGSN